MNLSFRKTTQLLAPATHSSHNGVFNIYPAYPIGAPRSQLRVVGVASHSLELATDPAAEVLIAYEMNSEPLAPITGRRSV